MSELFLEIGSEELPARFIEPALEELRERLFKRFSDAGLVKNLAIEYLTICGTPRRLAIHVPGVVAEQERVTKRVSGPSAQVAYDADGNLTKAAEGFARKNGKTAADLIRVETDKGEYIALDVEEGGGKTIDLLPSLLAEVIASLPFPKSMRWGSGKFRYARPLHWLVALFDGQVIDLEVEGIRSGNKTRGHRFHAPAEFAVSSFDDYKQKLREAKVIVDIDERRQSITQAAVELAKSIGGEVDFDAGAALIETVKNLIEWPIAVLGSFDPQFLELPHQVLTSEMAEHQKYFPIRKPGSAELLPYFIQISNTDAKDHSVLAAGYRRVITARFEDGRYYYDLDRKRTLADRVDDLKSVVWQRKLGTSYEKMERFRSLAIYFCTELGVESAAVERVAELCKADLVTGMVGEFPKLQGIMGAKYATLDGESAAVATGIYEHYLPRFADDELPSGIEGAIVGVADRMDTLAACFGVSLLPSGSADPYALRRAAISVLRIIAARDWKVSLRGLITEALSRLGEKLTRDAAEVAAELQEFLAARLAVILADDGLDSDVVEAVLALGVDVLPAVLAKANALQALRSESGDFSDLAAAYKRTKNLLKKIDGAASLAINESALTLAAEKNLHAELLRVREQCNAKLAAEDYAAAMRAASEIRPALDAFFAGVMVMSENETERSNRLALLAQVDGLFSNLADFSRLAGAQ